MDKKFKKIVFAALMTALEFVVTYSVRIPLPVISGAYLNAGDSVVYLGTFFSGGVFAALAAGLGSALSDLFAGAGAYVLPTFIIKGLMSVLCWVIYKKGSGVFNYLFGSLAAGFLMVGGYFIVECFMYGAAVAAVSLPGNFLQLAFGVAISVPAYFALRKVPETFRP